MGEAGASLLTLGNLVLSAKPSGAHHPLKTAWLPDECSLISRTSTDDMAMTSAERSIFVHSQTSTLKSLRHLMMVKSWSDASCSSTVTLSILRTFLSCSHWKMRPKLEDFLRLRASLLILAAVKIPGQYLALVGGPSSAYAGFGAVLAVGGT